MLPFPVANSVKSRRLLDRCSLVPACVERPVVCVRRSRRSAPACWPARSRACSDASVGSACYQPGAEAVLLPVVGTHKDHVGGLDEQRSQILAARLERRPRIGRPPVLCCRGMRPSQAPKSRPRSNASPVPDRCDHGGRDQRADAGNGLQPRTVRFALADQLDVARHRLDVFVEPEPVLVERLSKPELDGFWIHLDADVLDDADAGGAVQVRLGWLACAAGLASYSTEGGVVRSFLMPARRLLASRRRRRALAVGLVGRRGAGLTAARRRSATSRSSASWRLRSWVR